MRLHRKNDGGGAVEGMGDRVCGRRKGNAEKHSFGPTSLVALFAPVGQSMDLVGGCNLTFSVKRRRIIKWNNVPKFIAIIDCCLCLVERGVYSLREALDLKGIRGFRRGGDIVSCTSVLLVK
mmetsp:Transcript_43612/g.132744  ORF Transcript_43612/g.132744 Transcript_43612/m.132744 type:complete len:122 (-) Transcript_43612:374-739(-)